MRTLSAIAIASVILAVPLHAQGHPQTRSGFTISFGFGSGSATFDCNGCDTHSQNGGTGYLRMGGTVRPDLIVAGELNGWTKSQNGATLSISTADALVQWYPDVTGGFYVEGGIGAGSITTQYVFGNSTLTQSQSGVGYQFGAGYDWRVGRNFSLTPYAKYLSAQTGSSSYGSSNAKLNAKVFQLGLGFTWH